MKLADWLDGDEKAVPPREKMTHADFGRRIGRPQPTVSRYANGERIPEQEIMTKIFEVTGGQVTANDFYGIEAPPTAPDAPAERERAR